jgi:hypothetical protein
MEEQEEGEYVPSSLSPGHKKESLEKHTLTSDKASPSTPLDAGKQAKRVKLSVPKRKFCGISSIEQYSIQEKVGEGTFGYIFHN